MRRLCLLLVSLLITGSASAQSLVIHGHPQASIYATPAEWPTFAPQCHGSSLTTTGGPSVTAHLPHLVVTAPIYAELRGEALTIPFTVMLYKTAGYVVSIKSELGYAVIDANGGWVDYMHLQGNPTGLVMYPGHFVIDPALAHGDSWYGPGNINRHGWTMVQIQTRVILADGTENFDTVTLPFYSMLHPEEPEHAVPDGVAKLLRADCLVFPPGEGNDFGSQIVEFRDYIPLKPLAAHSVWNARLFVYTYGEAPHTVQGAFTEYLDPDLHNGVTGTLISTNPDGAVFDTRVMGSGAHKLNLGWITPKVPGGGRPGTDPNEIWSAILQVNVNVADGVVPTPTCQDPAATNVGGPLPCVYPPPPVDVCPNIAGTQATIPVGMVLQNGQCVTPPPPVPEWHSFTPSFFRLLDMLEVCDPTDHKCVVLGLAQP